MYILKNYNYILNTIKILSKTATLIVVTKNQPLDNINLLIKINHFHFGENRVQEATSKWKNLISTNSQLKLHLIGKLQSNKVKDAFQIFHYIHTLDNEKLAQIFSKFESNSLKKIKYFIQVNFGNEVQKSGVSLNKLTEFISFCRINTSLDIVGLMCIPPLNENASECFKVLKNLAVENSFSELSMGMSGDYLSAVQNGSTFVRIGSAIFGDRTN